MKIENKMRVLGWNSNILTLFFNPLVWKNVLSLQLNCFTNWQGRSKAVAREAIAEGAGFRERENC